MPEIPTLTDDVVTLRAPRPADAPGSWEQCQDPESQRWTTVPVPYALADAESYLGRHVPQGWAEDTEWGFVVEAEGRYVGTVSLRNEGAGRGEIAFGSHPWARGTGYVERALRLLLEWGFTARGLRVVMWRAHRGNWASRKLAWRLGFTVEGTVRGLVAQRGELRDAWIGTLLREDARAPRTAWLECPVLEDDGLRLRPIVEADAGRIVEACSEDRTQHWLGQLPAPYTRADALAYVDSRTAQLADGSGATWAVTEGGGRLRGTIGYFDLVPGESCEIGYWTHPDSRGRGLSTRALGIVTGHVFRDVGVVRATAHAAVANTASRHVIEACGYRSFGVERRGAVLRTGRADLALYDLLAEEWPSRR